MRHQMKNFYMEPGPRSQNKKVKTSTALPKGLAKKIGRNDYHLYEGHVPLKNTTRKIYSHSFLLHWFLRYYRENNLSKYQ